MRGFPQLGIKRADPSFGLIIGYETDPVIRRVATGSVSISPGSVGATSVASITVTLSGVAPGDIVILEPPSGLEAGLAYAGVRVAANDTLNVLIANVTAAAVATTARSWRYLWFDLT